MKIDNDLYVRDYAKCVLCYKCVEACGPDHQNTFAIAVAGRGFDAHISTEFAVPLPESACVYCGNCIAVCPTGALMAKTEFDLRAGGRVGRVAQTATDTICPYCGVGCTLRLHVQDGEIVKATSPLDNAITLGNLCIKGRFGWRFVQNLRRRGRERDGRSAELIVACSDWGTRKPVGEHALDVGCLDDGERRAEIGAGRRRGADRVRVQRPAARRRDGHAGRSRGPRRRIHA